MSKKIFKIVLTGGPCSGKTSSRDYLKKYYEDRGWVVYVVPETATILFESGVTYRNGDMTIGAFQRAVAEMQKMHEDKFVEIAKRISAEKVLILYDRGIMDGGAYMEPEDFYPMIEEVYDDKTENILNRYDMVIHLVTTAIGAPNFYSYNNPMRSETPEQAAEKDRKTEKLWSAHHNLLKIDNSTNFEQKLKKISDLVDSNLGNI